MDLLQIPLTISSLTQITFKMMVRGDGYVSTASGISTDSSGYMKDVQGT